MRRTILSQLIVNMVFCGLLLLSAAPLQAQKVVKDLDELPEGLAQVIRQSTSTKPAVNTDQGLAVTGKKLAPLHPIALLVTSETQEPLARALARAAEKTGVILVVPTLAEKDDTVDLEASMKNFDSVVKTLREQRKITTGQIWLVGVGQDSATALALAVQQASRVTGLLLVAPERIELDEKQLAKAKGLQAIIYTYSDEDDAMTVIAQANRKRLEQAGWKVQIQAEQIDSVEKLLAAKGDEILSHAIPPAEEQVAQYKGLDEIDQLYMKGKYRLAVAGYRKFAKQADHQVAAAIGLARALHATGQYSDAIEALQAASEVGADRSDWHLAIARALQMVGKYDKALEHIQIADRLRPKWAPTLLTHGRLLETLGRKEQAIDVYKQMTAITAGDGYRNDAVQLVALGEIYDRYAILSGMRASEQASNILHNYLQEAYQKADENYWPAHIAAGHFLLSKHRPQGAAEEFQLALKKNPQAVDAIIGMGAIALDQWNFEACLKMADKALEINPNHPEAMILKATCMLAWRKYEEAPPLLERALAVNPNHLDALSLMAASYVRLHDEKKTETYADRVREINENYYGLELAIAEWLAAGRQFDQAEQHYLKAIEMAPELAEPLTGLGKLYMQTGEEVKAQETLRKARDRDDFREDVANFLVIVDRILDPERFVVRETENFIIKVDKKYDLIMLDQMAEYMEEIYEQVCGDFGHYPKDKTIVEIMPTHQQFSLRIAGRGWIGTVGAATGRVIVLAAPHQERSQLGLHNWAMVMRHEFTHTVTLAATDNNIPHWFTEACAVWQQPDKRNYRYVQMLVNAVRGNRLFPLDEIDWGFIRPKRRGDRSLAYAQAEWMLEYIISEHGFGKVTEMLELFRQALPQKQVIKQALGIDEKTFDKRFAKWARAQAQQWGFNVDPAPNLGKARKQAKRNKEDAAAQADYAYALYRSRKLKEADQQADKALKLDKNNSRALSVKAVIALIKKDYDKAIQFAGRVEKVDPSTNVVPRILAQSYLAKRNYIQAISALELLKQRQPLDSYSYTNLAKIYQQYGQPEKALPNLLHLHRHTMREPEFARQIAEIYRMLDKDELALTYFKEIAFINPYESSAYESIAAIYMRQRQFDEAIKAANNLLLLEPESAKAWDYMAVVRYRAGQSSQDINMLREARKAAERSIELDPSGKGQRILDAINRIIDGLEKAA